MGMADMSNLFSNMRFNGDISRWDVSKVTNMEGMFYKSYLVGTSVTGT